MTRKNMCSPMYKGALSRGLNINNVKDFNTWVSWGIDKGSSTNTDHDQKYKNEFVKVKHVTKKNFINSNLKW